MCGITGFAGSGNITDLKNMTHRLIHRGPDGEGFWEDKQKSIHLGHRRLSIIDIHGGDQPMRTEDGQFVIIYNGEIYNHQLLRKELEALGHRFKTDHSDTEALLVAYRQWGNATPEKLDGMWAFAVYNKIKNEIFISRDRFGKKPLYYTLQNGTFAFSSELASLIRHSNIQSNISERSLKKYFAYGYIPAPRSLFEKIYKLPAGCNLQINCDDLTYRTHKYWDFIIEPVDTLPKNPVFTWGEEIKQLLSEAVKKRLMSDVPLGIFLSGGIDSSAITLFAKRSSGAQNLKTFCTGFIEDSFDESAFAQHVSSYLQTEHYTETLSIEKAKSMLPKILEQLDEPMGDSSLLPTYLLCKNTKKQVTVALGGDGSDELFAGYDPFRALKLSNVYAAVIPKPVHQAIRMVVSKIPVSNRNISLDFKIKQMLRGLSYPKKLWNPVWLGPAEPREFEELFTGKIDIEDIYSEAIEQWDDCKQTNIIDKTLQFYTKLYLQDSILTKIDRAGMMNSLEVRSPFLDIDLINLVRKIPWNYKYRKCSTKYILKMALKDILPKSIIHRKKHGFGMPVGKWISEKKIAVQMNLPISSINQLYANGKYLEHMNKKSDNRLFLYNYLVLGKYLDALS